MDEQASAHGLLFTTAAYRETGLLGASSLLAVGPRCGRDGIYFRVCSVSLTDAEEHGLGDVHLDYASEKIRAAFL